MSESISTQPPAAEIAAVEHGQQDSTRLDWIDDAETGHDTGYVSAPGATEGHAPSWYYVCDAFGLAHDAPTLRAAIDKAMFRTHTQETDHVR